MPKTDFLTEHYKNLLTLILFAGLVIGMLTANLFFRDYLEQVDMMISVFSQKYQYTDIDGAGLLFYLMRVRLPVFLFLAIAGRTRWGGLCTLFYTMWIGFSGGMLLAMASIRQGFSGILLILASMLPQYLVYIPGLLLLFYGVFTMASGKKGGAAGSGKNRKYLLIFAIAFFLFLIGLILEAYVNPIFVKRILKNY